MLVTNISESEIEDFNLTLDPKSLDPESAARAREELKTALAALDGGVNLTDAD